MTNQEHQSSGTQPFIRPGRLGFHYFPDTLHYTERDLQQWLPVLLDLGASWLVIRSDATRAIPEIPVAPGEEHWLLDTSLDEVYWPCSHSRAMPSFPSQLEWK